MLAEKCEDNLNELSKLCYLHKNIVYPLIFCLFVVF